MRKPSLRALIVAKEAARKTAGHRSRERIQRELRVLRVAEEIKRQLRKERRAA